MEKRQSHSGGGDGTYTFTWDDGSAQTTATATGLIAGDYNVTVADGNGCTATDNVTIQMSSTALSVQTVMTDVTVFGGSDGEIDVTAQLAAEMEHIATTGQIIRAGSVADHSDQLQD